MTKIKPKSLPPRFDADALRSAGGDKVFVRGQAYYSGGQVEILGIERNRIRARVAGTDIYRTELQGSGRRFSGQCTCPAFARDDFCKHLVATALAVNAMDAGAADAVRNRFAQIRDHLRTKGTEALVEMIMEVAERDPDLRRHLELAVASESKDDDALVARFKLAITDVTRTSGFIEYREIRAWASNVEVVLKQIGGLIDRTRAPLVLRLLDHFFNRMEKALQSVDDSDGDGAALLALASDLHLKACRAAKPEPVGLARELFRRETEWQWDSFYNSSKTYRALLGKAGLAEYRRLAETAWAEIKPLRCGARRVQDDQFALRYRLQSILESFAARDGDIDAMVAIRARNLSSAYTYLQVAKLCADHGRMADALKWAEEGLWQFEDDPDRRLIAFTSDLRRRLSRADSPGTGIHLRRKA